MWYLFIVIRIPKTETGLAQNFILALFLYILKKK